ncbi:MAG: glucosaminidase domain-containing protein, partial [Clostridium sp.]|uniref:glucosaminidase domain-containing protein n=1 Tax=Clostridium sp. TaxID=1506 RepID=UPI002907D483|nr:glucosaminidase domain-containing protein [Clostridium sp.]
MYRRNKKIACALALLMVVNNVSTSGILAYSKEKQTQTVAIKVVNDVNIVSTTTVTIEDAKRWAKKRNATQTFIGLADLFWKYAPSRGGVNPALAYVQSALETGYGRFGNVLDETYYNTCGLKRTETGTADDNNDKEAHKRFDNWDHGVQAHLDHLALYAGAPGFPKTKIEQNYLGNNLSSNATYDPRHFGYLAGKAKTATQLSNSWATSVEYGEKLVELYNSLLSEAESGRRGWLQDGDDWYYYNETGELHKGWLKLSDGTYYLNENGIVHKGWFQEGDNKYYFDNFGRAIIGRTETINGKSYTFDKEGKLVKENLKSGWHYEDYYWQYYKDGKRQHGWINIPNDGKYYVESYGMVKGWYDVEGKRYYFDDAGRAIVGKTIEIEGKEYAFDNEGVLVKALKSGWHYEDYYWQYYKDGERQYGWINVP